MFFLGEGSYYLFVYFVLFLKLSGDSNVQPGLRTADFNHGHGQIL